METNLLGEYIESIRERHPQLSMRQMALDAGRAQYHSRYHQR